MDYRNRFYSTELGRFLKTDPIRLSGGDINFYRYAKNNPIVLFDPTGLEWECSQEYVGSDHLLCAFQEEELIDTFPGSTSSVGVPVPGVAQLDLVGSGVWETYQLYDVEEYMVNYEKVCWCPATGQQEIRFTRQAQEQRRKPTVVEQRYVVTPGNQHKFPFDQIGPDGQSDFWNTYKAPFSISLPK